MTNDLMNWSNQQRCQNAVESLGENGFAAIYCKTSRHAFDYIVDAASGCASVGFGGSLSINDLKIEEVLRNTGKELLIHGKPRLSLEERLSIMRRQLTCDLFLTGANAITLTGSLVNIDASGNRAG